MERRFDKINLVVPGGQQRGTLLVHDGLVEFESGKGTLPMPHVHSVSSSNGTVDVEYGQPPSFATAHFVDASHGLTKGKVREANVELEHELQEVVTLDELSEEDEKRLDEARQLAEQAELKKAKTQARWHMGGGTAVALFGVIATVVSYSGADAGSSYTVWWGAMLIGAIWLIGGIVELFSAQRKEAEWLKAHAPHDRNTGGVEQS